MAPATVALKKLRERALARDGDLPLGLLLEHVVPVERLRELATEFGVTPKGGFRIERAPARILAPKLAEERDPERLDRVLSALLEPPTPVDPPDRAGSAEAGNAAQEARALLALRDQEVKQLREELELEQEDDVHESHHFYNL